MATFMENKIGYTNLTSQTIRVGFANPKIFPIHTKKQNDRNKRIKSRLKACLKNWSTKNLIETRHTRNAPSC